eukprot:102554_1
MAHLKNVDPDDDLTIPYVKRFCEPPSTTSFIIRYNKFLHPTNYPPIHRYPRHDPPEDLSYLNYWERPTWFGGITGLLGFGYGLRQVQIWGWNSSTTRKKYPFTSSRMRTRTLMRYTLQWGCFGAWVGLVSVGIAHIRKRDEVANCNFAFLTTVIPLTFFMKSFKRAATFAAASWAISLLANYPMFPPQERGVTQMPEFDQYGYPGPEKIYSERFRDMRASFPSSRQLFRDEPAPGEEGWVGE